MVGPNRFFEDAARVAGGDVDSLAGLRGLDREPPQGWKIGVAQCGAALLI